MSKIELVINLNQELMNLIPESRHELILKRLAGELEDVMTNYQIEHTTYITQLPGDKRIRDLFIGIEIRKTE